MTGKARARRIKMILSDVDGTLTDGTLAVLPDGEEIKAYHVRDGLGVLLAHIAGLRTGIITGKTSKALEKRAERLKIFELHQGAIDKRPIFEDIARRNKLRAEEIAYIGDDIGDLEVMKRAGLAGAVADAHPAIRRHAHYVCRRAGGRGAFREFVEYIIGAQGKWDVVEAAFQDIFEKRADKPKGGEV
jgi:3-deoxy-D-manno-octulosonate 8-phosphate phosphatase (KDO 8-P phosphatase)